MKPVFLDTGDLIALEVSDDQSQKPKTARFSPSRPDLWARKTNQQPTSANASSLERRTGHLFQ
jgi:hypothetical protein